MLRDESSASRGSRVGVLFQPRWMDDRPLPNDGPPGEWSLVDRRSVVCAAVEVVLLGDASRFDRLFTEDVQFRSPHVVAESLADVHRAVGAPEDALSGARIKMLGLVDVEDRVVAEWRLDAWFTGPVLFDDRFLIEPTGDPVHLDGVSVAEFRGSRISVFRHYFDDTELLAGVPGAMGYLRWTTEP